MTQIEVSGLISSDYWMNQREENTKTSVCYGCGHDIKDRHILRVAPDLEWHANCLKCVECHKYLDEKCTCFVRDKKVYCKTDYNEIFGIKCVKCKQKLDKTDFVMRINDQLYHRNCFRCFACSLQLIPGNKFVIRDNNLYCKNHLSVASDIGYNEKSELLNQKEHKIQPITDTRRSNCPSFPIQLCSGPYMSNRQTKKDKKDKMKTTRIRTVLNEKQLQMLRACYGANPRPDALLKEQLVEMTGLSPRVIRVWFQNKRCKDKKRQIAAKQMQLQQQDDKSTIMMEKAADSNYNRANQVLPNCNQLPQFIQSNSIWPAKFPSSFVCSNIDPQDEMCCDEDISFHNHAQNFSPFPYQTSCTTYSKSASYEDDIGSISSHFHGSDLSSPCSE